MKRVITSVLLVTLLASCSQRAEEVVDIETTPLEQVTTLPTETTLLEETTTSPTVQIVLEELSGMEQEAVDRFLSNSSKPGDARFLLTDVASWSSVFSKVLGVAKPVTDEPWRRYSEPPFYQDSTVGWRRAWSAPGAHLSERVFLTSDEQTARDLSEYQSSYWMTFATEHRGNLSVSGLPNYSGFYASTEPRDPALPCVGVSVAAFGRIVLVSEVETASCDVTPAPWAETSVLNMLARAQAIFPQ
jgi:hypothetical protein